MPLWWPLNRAKAKVPFFKTKTAFLVEKTKRGLGTDFRFFVIDIDGVVYASGKKVLEPGTYKSSSSLSEILRWLTWFMTATKSISPRASSEDLTVEKIEDTLTQLRNCFGPKNPISSKKIKIQK